MTQPAQARQTSKGRQYAWPPQPPHEFEVASATTCWQRGVGVVIVDDKRLIPEFGKCYWCKRTSEHKWHWCKYCARKTSTFLFREGEMGSLETLQTLRCCWECGSGLENVTEEEENE